MQSSSKFIIPIDPEDLRDERYFIRSKIERPGKKLDPIPIPVLTLYYDHKPPKGWLPYVHPEGVNYFHHPAKRLWTETALHEAVYLDAVEAYYSCLIDYISQKQLTLPEQSDLVLVVTPSPIESTLWVARYYFVHHPSKSVFWVHEQTSSNCKHADVVAVRNLTQLGVLNSALYWLHCELFPLSRGPLYVTSDVADLKALLLHHQVELTSARSDSLSPINSETINVYLDALDRADTSTTMAQSTTMFVIGRLMHFLLIDKFYNYYGQDCVRLQRGASVFATDNLKPRRMWWLRLIRPVLFFASDSLIRRMEIATVDNAAPTKVWETTVASISREIDSVVLIGSVLLAANVGFLSIGNVQPQGDDGLTSRTAGQILSYVSTILGLGSIIIGLLVLRMNQGKTGTTPGFESVTLAERFLSTRSSRPGGIEALAVLYALPFALLMWAFVLFCIAFTAACMEHTESSVRAITGVAFGIVSLLTMWGVQVVFDFEGGRKEHCLEWLRGCFRGGARRSSSIV